MSSSDTKIFVQNLTNAQRSFAITMGNVLTARFENAIRTLERPLDSPSFEFLSQPDFEPFRLESSIRQIAIDQLEFEIPEAPGLVDPDRDGTQGRTTFFGGSSSDTPPAIDHQVGRYRRPSFPDNFNFDPPEVDLDLDIPDKPDFIIPDRQVLTPIEIPEAPVINLPDETVPLPTLDLTGKIPEDSAQEYIDRYNDFCNSITDKLDLKIKEALNKFFPNLDTLTGATDDLLLKIINGDKTVYTNQLEEKLFARTRNRIQRELDGEREEIKELARETGNPIMPLRVRAGLLRINDRGTTTTADALADLERQKAEREYDLIKFGLQSVQAQRELMLNMRRDEMRTVLEVNSQSLQAAEKFLDSLYREAELLINVYNAELRGVEVKLKELEDKRRFVLAELEIYKGRLDGARLESQINTQKLEQDRLSVQILQALYQAYEAEIRGVVAEADLRKIPVEIFSENVKAYAAYVNGVRGETEVFTALINADVETIRGQVEAVRGWVAGKQVELQELEFDRFRLEKDEAFNRAQIQYYEAQTANQKFLLDIQRTLVEVAKIGVDTDIERFRVQAQTEIEKFKTTNQLRLDVVRLNASYTEAIQRVSLAFTDVQLTRNKAIADVQAQSAGYFGTIGAAAMNGINNLVSVNLNETEEA